MVPEFFVLLLLLYNGEGGYEEVYIGKITDCLHAESIVQKKVLKDKIINRAGYICTRPHNWVATKYHLKKLEPIQQKLVNDLKERLPKPEPKPLPPIKRKE